MEPRTSEQHWMAEVPQLEHVQVQPPTMHIQTLEKLTAKAESDPNTLGFIVFGSVANGTHHEGSDIDVISILRSHRSSSGINQIVVDGIVVDSMFMTQDVLNQSVRTVPYLLHTLGGAKLLLDREGTVEPLLDEIRKYFAGNPEIEGEWSRYIEESKIIKQQTGCRASGGGKTIIDVWNELERSHSGGRIRRPFFNSVYLINPHLFYLVKKLLVLKGGGRK